MVQVDNNCCLGQREFTCFSRSYILIEAVRTERDEATVNTSDDLRDDHPVAQALHCASAPDDGIASIFVLVIRDVQLHMAGACVDVKACANENCLTSSRFGQAYTAFAGTSHP